MSNHCRVVEGFYGEHETDGGNDHKLCTTEAQAAVKEVAFGVREIRISEALPYSSSLTYLNVLTLEGERICVQISAAGFRPVGVFYDDVVGPVPPPPKEDEDEDDNLVDEQPEEENYETIYALLSARSSGFRDKFSLRLSQRLIELQSELAAKND